MNTHYSEERNEDQGSAAQIRVTPQELAKALAALEVRKAEVTRRHEEEKQRWAETISLGEAVKDLYLDSTPEELWAHIKAQRSEREEEDHEAKRNDLGNAATVEPGTVQPTLGGHASRKTTAVSALCIGLAALCLFLSRSITSARLLHQLPGVITPTGTVTTFNEQTDITLTPDKEFYRKLRLSQGPNPAYRLVLVSTIGRLDELRQGETLYPLRAVPDGYSVYDIAYTKQFAAISFDTNAAIAFRAVDDPGISNMEASNSAPPMIITRYDGNYYLRCWLRPEDRQALQQHHQVTLYFSAEDTTKIPITVKWQQDFSRLLFFQAIRVANNMALPGQLVLPEGQQVVLNQHAWENFSTLTLPPYTPPDWAKIPGVFSDSPFSHFLDYREFDASSVLSRVADVPDNQSFHGGEMILDKLAFPWRHGINPNHAVPLSETLVDVRPDLDRPYTFVKHDGHLYLRGWTPSRLSESQMRGHNINLYFDETDPTLGETPVQIQLRVDRCHFLESNSQISIPVTDVHLDKHAWEKW